MEKQTTYMNWKLISGFFLLYFVVVLCYIPVFSNGFLDSWDDQWMVMNVFTERGWTFENIYALFTQTYKGQYSPLVELNYMFLYSVGEYNPFWFHLMNVVWHCSCVTLVFFLVRNLLVFSKETDVETATRVACLTTILFAIHPVNVETVAWVSAVKVSMYTFFYLLSLLLYLRYVMSQKIVYYILSLFCFICSGLSKEQAVVLPVLLLLIDWFIKRNLRSADVWMEKGPFFIISVGFIVLTFDLQGERMDAVSYSIGQRFLFGCFSLFEYITKSVIPVNLNYLYPFPIVAESSEMPIRFYIYPVLVVGLVYSLYSFRRNRILLFGSLFFLLHLLLSLHIVPMPRHGIVADRYLYLPLVGMLMILCHTILVFVKSWKAKFVKILLCTFILLLYSLYFGIYTYQYSKKWENSESVKEYLRGFYKGDSDTDKIEDRESHD